MIHVKHLHIVYEEARQTICAHGHRRRGGMSGWKDGDCSDKESKEKKTQCVTGILNCKGATVEPKMNFSALDQIWGTATVTNGPWFGKS